MRTRLRTRLKGETPSPSSIMHEEESNHRSLPHVNPHAGTQGSSGLRSRLKSEEEPLIHPPKDRKAERHKVLDRYYAKVERLFWSLKRWWRVSLVPTNLSTIQKRLDDFATWHNLYRPHASLGILTPSEAELGLRRLEPIRYTEGDELEPKITIRRHHVGDDPRLLYPVIKVKPKHRSAA